MTTFSDVAIVGAGPYGLSIAAHLRQCGVGFRIFGSPLQTWREHMPKGMWLKSDGFATNLYDPETAFTLKRYCAEHGLDYHDTSSPVRLETFTAYAMAFQARLVPEVDDRQVVALERATSGFVLRLDDGEIVTARRVILAVGISHFHHVPSELAHLPSACLSHSADHHDLEHFKGREVAVIGAGASALDFAALLHEAGAAVQVIARAPAIRFHSGPGSGPRSLWQRIRHPSSGIGPGLRSRIYTEVPWLFRYLPEALRHWIVREHLGPAPGWFTRDRVVGHVPLLVGQTVRRAEFRGGRVVLGLVARDGTLREHTSEHVIAATGYRPDLRRLPFLGEELRSAIRAVAHTPILSANFESSVAGLYLVGPAAANTFGPVMRFMVGAEFTAQRVAGHLAWVGARGPRSAPATVTAS
jgi:flavin-dependent dehydrogenase